MRGLSKPTRFVFFLSGLATSTPIVGEYVMSFCLLVWQLTGGRWRQALLGRRAARPATELDRLTLEGWSLAARPLHWGVLAYVLSHLLAALLGMALSAYAKPVSEVMRAFGHVFLKLGVEWLVLSSAMITATRFGYSPTRIGKWLALWLLVNFAYCVVQRQTGIDWTHGWHATLGEHRYAYGVYRVSGFMGHPLTFAYNLMLILLGALALAWRQGAAEAPAWRGAWWVIVAICAVTLLISGSRFVLIVIAAVLAVCEWRRLVRRWPLILGGLAAAGVGLWAQGTMLARWGELFDEKVPLLVRFPRLIFWQVHARMFRDFPVTGVTMAGAADALKAYYSAAGYHDNMYEAHNVFLQTLADTGLIGLVGLLAFLGSIFLAAKRMHRWTNGAQGLSYLLAGTVITGLMQNDLRDSAYLYALWFYLSLLLAHAAALGARQRCAETDERESPQNLQSPAGRADPP